MSALYLSRLGTLLNHSRIEGNVLITPPTSAGALEGITRNAVMEIAKFKLKLLVKEEYKMMVTMVPFGDMLLPAMIFGAYACLLMGVVCLIIFIYKKFIKKEQDTEEQTTQPTQPQTQTTETKPTTQTTSPPQQKT